jgi:hypothetical protein
MGQSLNDHRTQELNDRMAGRWFTQNRTRTKKNIELFGRSMALTFRILLLKQIGTETYSFKMVVVGFLLLRLFSYASLYVPGAENPFSNFYNPFSFQSVEASLLDMFSVFFVVACGWYVARTEFYRPTSERQIPNVLEHGEANILKPLVNEDKSIFTTESFVQSVIAPILLLGVGLGLRWFGVWPSTSLYLCIGSAALFYDEANHYRAVILTWRRKVAGEIRAKKMASKHEKWRQGHQDED